MPARKRICPGRFFADEIVWLAIASMLHTLCISKPAPAAGAKDAEVRWCSGLVRYVRVRYGLRDAQSTLSLAPLSVPSEFPFKIEPRFAEARDLVGSGESSS